MHDCTHGFDNAKDVLFFYVSFIKMQYSLFTNPDGCVYPFLGFDFWGEPQKRYCKPAGIGLIEMPKPFVSDNFNIGFFCLAYK